MAATSLRDRRRHPERTPSCGGTAVTWPPWSDSSKSPGTGPAAACLEIHRVLVHGSARSRPRHATVAWQGHKDRLRSASAPTGQQERNAVLGDSCQSSGLYGPVRSGQVRLGGVSVQCGLVRSSKAWWNDRQNDHEASGEGALRPARMRARPEGQSGLPDRRTGCRRRVKTDPQTTPES
jgi:hypothetical protein